MAQAFRDEERGRHALNGDSFSLMEDVQLLGLTDGVLEVGYRQRREETLQASLTAGQFWMLFAPE